MRSRDRVARVDDRERARWQEHGRRHGYIRARLRLLTTQQGGRRSPISSGYRSCWRFPPEVHAEMHDGPLVLEEQQLLELGAVATVRLYPLVPSLWPDVYTGMHLDMFEGSRQVGEAVVLEVVGPER